MLNPISQRKGWGRKSEKKEKEKMERKKEKEKYQGKIMLLTQGDYNFHIDV